jgi:hypothetical protein
MEMTTKGIQQLIATHGTVFAGTRQSAAEARKLIETISPDIEQHTAAICITCTGVCCINRHARYDLSDTIFLSALGLTVPEYASGIEETAPCRLLGNCGCTLHRSLRPYRCTWFFCAPLLDHIVEQYDPAAYRQFMKTLQAITETRTRMIRDFEEAAAKIPRNRMRQ